MLFYLLLKRKTKENKRTLSPCNYIFISDFLFMFFRFIFCVINCLLVNKLTWNLTKETCSPLQPADFHLLQSIISLQHKGYYTNYPPPNFPSSFVQFLISSSVFSFTKLPRWITRGLNAPPLSRRQPLWHRLSSVGENWGTGVVRSQRMTPLTRPDWWRWVVHLVGIGSKPWGS